MVAARAAPGARSSAMARSARASRSPCSAEARPVPAAGLSSERRYGHPAWLLQGCRRSAMIRVRPVPTIGRRRILRAGFAGAASLVGAGVLGSVVPFMRVRRLVGLGAPVAIGPKARLLATFAETNDAPILF